jgi:hypothetical protein
MAFESSRLSTTTPLNKHIVSLANILSLRTNAFGFPPWPGWSTLLASAEMTAPEKITPVSRHLAKLLTGFEILATRSFRAAFVRLRSV